MSAIVNGLLAGIVGAGILGAFAIPERISGDQVSGMAYAIDGDTIAMRAGPIYLRTRIAKRIRLAEIDAPERAQTCLDAQGRVWGCGEAATDAMRAMLARDSAVTCSPRSHDRYGRLVAICRNSDSDLGGMLVAIGLAVTYPRYSTGIYGDRQSAAKAAHLGMWGGTFVNPWDWRHSGGHAKAP